MLGSKELVKQKSTFVDVEHGSQVSYRVVTSNDHYGYVSRKMSIPTIDLHFSDCTRKVYIHEWGESREENFAKLDKYIETLIQLRSDIQTSWDFYDKYNKPRYF